MLSIPHISGHLFTFPTIRHCVHLSDITLASRHSRDHHHDTIQTPFLPCAINFHAAFSSITIAFSSLPFIALFIMLPLANCLQQAIFFILNVSEDSTLPKFHHFFARRSRVFLTVFAIWKIFRFFDAVILCLFSICSKNSPFNFDLEFNNKQNIL